MGSDQLFQKKKFCKKNELARQKAKRSPYETIHIICEGKTECDYFNRLIKFFRLNTANVIAIPSEGSAPSSIVYHAFEIAKNTPNIDQIACVFDRDRHESYERAITEIKNHKPRPKDKSKPKYQTVTSTPCFEIWLLLHFCYTTKAYSYSGSKSAADHLIMDLRKYLASYSKGNADWFNKIINSLDTAIKNAKQLKKHNKKTLSINPSTNIQELIEFLKNIKA